jgi:hypothetical protein
MTVTFRFTSELAVFYLTGEIKVCCSQVDTVQEDAL